MKMNNVIEDIKNHLRPIFNMVNTPFYVSGGTISDIISFGYVTNDYDIIFENEDYLESFERQIKSKGAYFSVETPFSKVYNFMNCKLDLYQGDFGHPIDMVNRRDVLATTSFIGHDYLYMFDEGLEDSINRNIRMWCIQDGYKHRVKKYVNKGFKLDTTQEEKYNTYLESGKKHFYDFEFKRLSIW